MTILSGTIRDMSSDMSLYIMGGVSIMRRGMMI